MITLSISLDFNKNNAHFSYSINGLQVPNVISGGGEETLSHTVRTDPIMARRNGISYFYNPGEVDLVLGPNIIGVQLDTIRIKPGGFALMRIQDTVVASTSPSTGTGFLEYVNLEA